MKGTTAKHNTRLQLELKTTDNDDRPIFIAGNFNNWEAKEQRFQLTRQQAGLYTFQFPEDLELPNPLEYKYSRGGWQDEELDERGEKIPNRIIFNPQGTLQDVVPRWRRDGLNYNPTLLPIPQILSPDFKIPKLVKTRRIAALLPHDYHQTDKRYPVLYLQDGQNLFDDYAPFGSWGVDKQLAKMTQDGFGDIIVVAIDHAEEKRIKEFTPSQKTRLGKGNGKKYVRFLADSLKPYIDKNFRTLPEPEHTGIGGSSMGGLVSLYAGMMYPEVYSKWMIFSPSLWVAPRLSLEAADLYTDFNRRVYLYAGDNESPKLVERINFLKQTLKTNHGKNAVVDIKLSIKQGGEHNEYNWGQEFPNAVKWLFFNS